MRNMYRKQGFKKVLGIICAMVLLVSAIYVPVMVSAADPIPSVEIKDNQAYVFDFNSPAPTSAENQSAATGNAAIGYHGWGWSVKDGVLKSNKNNTNQHWATSGGYRLHAKISDDAYGFYALEPSTRYVVSFKIRVLSSPVTITGSKDTNKAYINIGYNSSYNSDPASGVDGSYVNGMSTGIKVMESLIDSNMFTLYDSNGNASAYACGEDWHTVTYFITTPASFTKDNALAFYTSTFHGVNTEIDDVSVTKIGADSGIILLKDEYSATDELFFGKEGEKLSLAEKDISDRAKDPSHTFEGWYANVERTEKITEIAFSKEEDKTVYSRWKAPVTVTFKDTLNGTETKITGSAGDTFEYPKDPVDPADKKWFMGWYKDEAATVAHLVPQYGYADETIYTYWKGEIPGLTQNFENYTKDSYTVNTDGNGQKYKSNRLYFAPTMTKQSEVTYGDSGNAIKYHWNPVQITDKEDHNYYDTSRVTAYDNYFHLGKGLENNTLYVVTFKYFAEKADAPVSFYMVTGISNNAWGSIRQYDTLKNVSLESDGKWHEITFQFTTNFNGGGIDVFFGINNIEKGAGNGVETIIYFDDIEIEAFAQPYESVITVNTNVEGEVLNIKGKRGEEIVIPEIEHPEGGVFRGWFFDQALTIPFDKTVYERQPLTVYGKWAEYFYIKQGFEAYTTDEWTEQVSTKDNGTPDDKEDDYTVTYKNNYLVFYTTMSKQSEVVNSGNYAVKFHWNTDPALDKDVSKKDGKNANNPESYEQKRYSAEDNLFYLGKGLEEYQDYTVSFKYKVEKGDQEATFYTLSAYSGNSWAGRKMYFAPQKVQLKPTDGWVECTYDFTTGAIGSNNGAFLGVKLTENEDVIMYFDDIKIKSHNTNEEVVMLIEPNTNEATIKHVAKRGDAINLPVLVHPEGYKFLGWYLDKNFNTPFTATVYPNSNTTIYAKWLGYSGFTQTFESYTADQWEEQETIKNNNTPNDTSDDYKAVYKSNYLTFYTTMSKQSDVVYRGNNAIKFHWNTDPALDKDVSKKGGKNILNPHSYEHSRYSSDDNLFYIGKDLEDNQYYTVSFKYKVEKADQQVQFYTVTAASNNSWGGRKIYMAPEKVQLKKTDGWVEYSYNFTTGAMGVNNAAFLGVKLTENEDVIMYFDDVKIKSLTTNEEVLMFLETNTAKGTIMHIGRRGEPLNLPKITHSDNAEFLGWFTDSAYTTPYEETVYPEANVVLYAKWGPFAMTFKEYPYANDPQNDPNVFADSGKGMGKGDDYALRWYVNRKEDNKTGLGTTQAIRIGSGIVNGNIYRIKFDYKGGASQTNLLSFRITSADTANLWWSDITTYYQNTYTELPAGGTNGWKSAEFVIKANVKEDSYRKAEELYIRFSGQTQKAGEKIDVYIDNLSVEIVEAPYVYFDAQNGGAGELVTGKPGDAIKASNPITRVGYSFAGWYNEPECETKFDLKTFAANTAVTAYAKWNESSIYVYSFENYTCTETSGFVLRNGGVVSNVKKSGKKSLRIAYNEANDSITAGMFALEDAGAMYNLEQKKEYVITVNYLIKEYSDAPLSMQFLASAYKNIYVGRNTGKTYLCGAIAISSKEAKEQKGKWMSKTFACSTADLDSEIYTELYCYLSGIEGWEIYIDDVTIRPLAKGQVAVAFNAEGAKGCPDYIIGKPGQSYEKKVPETLTREGMKFKGYFTKSADGTFLEKTRGNMVFGEKSELIYTRFLDYEIIENFDNGFYNKAYGAGLGYTIHDFDYEVYDSEKEGNSKDNVTSGRYSLHRKGNSMFNENSVILTLGNQIAEGERYTVTMKVKLGKHFHTDGAVKIVSSRSFEYAWTTTGDYYPVVPIADLKQNEWVEVSYTFNSVEGFVTLQTPGYVELFIDDVKFTLADESVPLSEPKQYTEYVAAERDANGNLLYKDRTAVDISTIIDASLGAKSFPWLYVGIGAGALLLVAVVLVLVLVVFKKKKA